MLSLWLPLLLLVGKASGQSSGCDNSCSPSYRPSNGMCEDGGLDSESAACALGTDCDDCGVRVMPPPPPAAPPQSPGMCDNSCSPSHHLSNGQCQDGGPGSVFSHCAHGTDCDDCGVRVMPPLPPSAPPQSPGMCDNTCIRCDFLGCSGLSSQTQADMAVYISDGECNDGGAGKRLRDSNPRASCQS